MSILPGNYTSLNIENCRLKSDGVFDFAVDLDQISLNPAGEIKFNPKKWSTNFKTSTLIDFHFSEAALDQLAKSIIEYPQLRSLDYQNSYFEKALSEFTSKDESNEMISSLNINGKIKKFPKLEVPLFLGDIRILELQEGMYLMEILELLISIRDK